MSPSSRRWPRRRHWWWWVLAALFVVVPIAEVYVLVQIGQAIGAWWTVLLLIADGVLGSLLVRHEGSRAWRALQSALSSRRMPAAELADGALILVGGTLLLTPGFLSDVLGLFCILPFTRPLARRVLARVITRRLAQGFLTAPSGSTRGSTFGRTTRPRTRGTTDPRTHDVVRGEVVDEE